MIPLSNTSEVVGGSYQYNESELIQADVTDLRSITDLIFVTIENVIQPYQRLVVGIHFIIDGDFIVLRVSANVSNEHDMFVSRDGRYVFLHNDCFDAPSMFKPKHLVAKMIVKRKMIDEPSRRAFYDSLFINNYGNSYVNRRLIRLN